jgi:rifampicin phosphotransferase
VTYTAWLDEIHKGDFALAGGKGANLGELSRAGFPVPPGFVLTTVAYDAFVESNDIGDAIAKLASVPETDGPVAFEEVAQRIHGLFSVARFPRR